MALAIAVNATVLAQEHAPAAAEHAEGAAHSFTDMLVALGWPLANFAIFVGVIYYFGAGLIRSYLADRSATIRKDLVEAAALKTSASAQLAEIDRKLHALPGEIEALKKRGADEIAAEEKRIAEAAAAERDRLLEQTRREIDLQVRLARREILEHAADLSVQLATDRIRKETTADDQSRMVDRYLADVGSREPGDGSQSGVGRK
jgi:F-type H+-transporting ATPase subunit b